MFHAGALQRPERTDLELAPISIGFCAIAFLRHLGLPVPAPAAE
jgi:hypothetical protein